MLEGTDIEHNINASILGREVHYIKINFRFKGNVELYEIPLDFFFENFWRYFLEMFFIHFIIIGYCCTVKTFMEGVLSEFMRIKAL